MDSIRRGAVSIWNSSGMIFSCWDFGEGELARVNFAQPRPGFSYSLIIPIAAKKYPDPTLVIFLLQRNLTTKLQCLIIQEALVRKDF